KGDAAAADEYDPNGRFIETAPLPLGVFSANCRYVLPFIALAVHGPDTWGVYDAHSRIRLVEFPWSEDGRTAVHLFRSWNPHHDGFLLMRSFTPSPVVTTTDMYDVAGRRIIKSWPDTAPLVWSGDGKSTVTVRDHHIVFEPIERAVLENSQN